MSRDAATEADKAVATEGAMPLNCSLLTLALLLLARERLLLWALPTEVGPPFRGHLHQPKLCV